MKKSLLIANLIDEHEGDFMKCEGCHLCKQIKKLTKTVPAEERFKRILNKKQDMTKSDIALLMENEVPRNKIRKALKMGADEFQEMMRNFGFGRSAKELAKLKLTVEEFIDLSKEKSKREIAKEKGVSEGTLYYWINRNEDKINTLLERTEQPNTAEKTTPKTNNPKRDKEAEYQQLINELSNKVSELTKENNSMQEKIKEYENINAACDDVESEIVNLREERDNYRSQLLESRDKLYRLDYSVENQKKIIEDTRKTLERYESENKALRALVRTWA